MYINISSENCFTSKDLFLKIFYAHDYLEIVINRQLFDDKLYFILDHLSSGYGSSKD